MTTTTADYETIDIELIEANPDQPRKHFDPDRLQELADSIAANGILQPIVVRKEGDHYVIVAGERRWRGSLLAGLDSMPATVIEMDEAAAYVLSVAENINRADMTVIEESDSFQQLVDYGHSVDDIATMFGKTKAFVEQRLSLRNLDENARSLVALGNIGPWLAKYIAVLSPENQRVVTNRWARGEFSHDTEASEFARALHATETEFGFFDMAEPTFEERQAQKRNAQKAEREFDRISRAAAALAEFSGQEPTDLAIALGTDVSARLREVERLLESATKARLNLRKAQKYLEASSLKTRQEIN